MEVRMSRTLIIFGLVLLAAGVVWPFIAKLGLGRLPGDIAIERPGFSFYFPLTTSLIISVVLSVVFWLVNR
jgi:membrane protein implicated in regulation of membrane protease activity